MVQEDAGVGMLIASAEDEDGDLFPPLARSALLSLIGQLREVHEKIRETGSQIQSWHRSNELSRRLETTLELAQSPPARSPRQ
ncbi:hypothetical protein REMIM1_PE00290 (plasmid) [Rhizobium etli bv. mimosae str. Mim1]|nr:hypothetical protein REMIM1_PE00290 [Rhizobium etli bv. mimosae str. Mim1]